MIHSCIVHLILLLVNMPCRGWKHVLLKYSRGWMTVSSNLMIPKMISFCSALLMISRGCQSGQYQLALRRFFHLRLRNIGVMMDSALNMESYISNVRKSCNLQIQNLSKLWNYSSEEAAKSLTHAFVTSRLENMNSLFYNFPNYQVEKLSTYSK